MNILKEICEEYGVTYIQLTIGLVRLKPKTKVFESPILTQLSHIVFRVKICDISK